LLAGKPINEPIVSGGPFVLSSEDELYQAYDDFSSGTNGFEGAHGWKSEIRNLKNKRPTESEDL